VGAFQAAADDGTEFAIFGSPLGQKVAMVKTLIEIESILFADSAGDLPKIMAFD
jgi:hypothetical protein